VEVDHFLGLVHALTGTEVKPLKANERDALASAIRDDSRRLDCSQLNELLLLVNKDRIEGPFFDYFFPKELTVALLPRAVDHFQRVAMLCFGNFVFAYRQLSRATSAKELRKLLEGVGRSREELEKSFKTRTPKILEIDPIARDQTFLIGYLSARQIAGDKLYADVLHAAAAELLSKPGVSWDDLLKRIEQLSQERDRAQILFIVARYRSLHKDHGVNEFAAALEKDVLPQLKQSVQELTDAQQRAAHNQDIYLTWDHMDVYFATSMRKRWEFEDLYDFVSGLMGRPELAELNLRYFGRR
jgi:hypothetical protein